MNGFFIDKLTMYQDHNEQLPLVGRSMFIEEDLQTGEIVSKTPKSLSKEGSYSTKLQIRCNGSRVTISGNPSRFNRIDNLFGLKTIDECVNVFNGILRMHDLPPFKKCTRTFQGQSEDGTKARIFSDGAIITAIDWTKNHFVGEGNVHHFLRGISSQSIGKGKVGFLYPDGNTASWGYGSYNAAILYNKEADLRRHKNKLLKNALADDIKYYEKLIDYCHKFGVVREEYKFKSSFLSKKNLKYYGLFNENEFAPYVDGLDKMIERCAVNGDKSMTIADKLLHNKIVKSRQSANSTQAYAMLWQEGIDIKSQLKQTQWYEHKRRLKSIGIDITIPFDVTRISPTLIKRDPIEISELLPPNWYRHAQAHTLRAV